MFSFSKIRVWVLFFALIVLNQLAFACQIGSNFNFQEFYKSSVSVGVNDLSSAKDAHVSVKGVNMLSVNSVVNKSVVNFPSLAYNKQMQAPNERPSAAKADVAKIPLGTLQAYKNINFRGTMPHIDVKYITPDGTPANLSSIQGPFEQAHAKLSQMAQSNDPKVFWTSLPEKLLQDGYIDSVYKTVEEFKKPFGDDSKLIFVTLGNPANTDEMAKALGLGSNLVYSCDVTPAQMNATIKKAGGDLDKIQIIISSKSGSTFESNQTYQLLVEALTEHYTQKGVKPEDMQAQISKHFLFITDKNPEKSKLKKLAEASGIKTIDCVEGHSAFADLAYSMPTLAYLGLPKEAAVRMVKAADEMSKSLMKQTDLTKNMAASVAAYDKIALDGGAAKEQFIFHDTHADFSSTIRQLYEESLRKLNFATNVYPRSAHSGLETAISNHIDGQPVNNITNVVTRVNYTPEAKEADYLKEAAKLEEAHIRNAQAEGHFQKQIVLGMGQEGITPESLGEFVTLKSFVTYYKNEFENNGQIDLYKQGYVNTYKKIREGL